MIKSVNKFEKVFKSMLPSPFSIAVILTLLTFLLALILTDSKSTEHDGRLLELMSYWEKGLWDVQLLVFCMQMMLMLVLGHVLALTKTVNNIIKKATRFCTNTANSAAIVTFLTLLTSFFNWGLGLIFGAIFAYFGTVYIAGEFSSWTFYITVVPSLNIILFLIATVIIISLAITPYGIWRLRRMDLVEKVKDFSS